MVSACTGKNGLENTEDGVLHLQFSFRSLKIMASYFTGVLVKTLNLT